MKLTSILREVDASKFKYLLRKPQLIKMLYNEIDHLTKGFKSDTGWGNVQKIWKVFDDLDLDWGITKSYYGAHEHDHTLPSKSKTWKFEIDFTNQNQKPDKIYGYLVAAGAGSVEDPLDKYDITVVMN